VTSRENPEAGPWIIALTGLRTSNISLSIVTEADLAGNISARAPQATQTVREVVTEVVVYTVTSRAVETQAPVCVQTTAQTIQYTVTTGIEALGTITYTATSYLIVPAGTEYRTVTATQAPPQGVGDIAVPIAILASIIAILAILAYLRRRRSAE